MTDTKDRYREDPSFRRGFRAQMRERYREGHPSHLRDCAGTRPEDFGKEREVVMPGGGTSRRLTLTTSEIATAMGYHPVVVYGWQSKGLFPRPTVGVVGKKGNAFTLSQARSILRTMGRHQTKCQFLRGRDGDTIKALHRAATNSK
jgi:hypothetical protein